MDAYPNVDDCRSAPQASVDERITEFIRLGLPKWMLDRVKRTAGKQQVCRFIRDAIEQKLQTDGTS
jgi:hypothetical protein